MTKKQGRGLVDVLAGLARRAAVWSARMLRWHPWVAAATVATAGVAIIAGRAGAVALVAAAGVVLGVWSQAHGASFGRVVGDRARASWRREVVYRRRWREAMYLSGLAIRFESRDVIPQLGRVRSTWASDLVPIKLVTAQEPIDWEARSGALAQTFGSLECNVRGVRVHWIDLEFVFRRDLPIVAPLPVPARPNLDALAVGRRGDGRVWPLRLTGTQVLIGGATNSGKGATLWSIVRALVAAIHDGWVTVWACDPKGGMELGHGPRDDTGTPSCPLFGRFAREPDDIADLLDAAVDLMKDRARRLSGLSRQHTPSVDDPTVVVLIDELADIAAFGTEQVRARVRVSLGKLLAQGRALGVHVIAAVQDPGQVNVEVRRAFPTRIALRTVDADQVDMILGKGAWMRGAKCERISEAAPGCGWVLLDGEREPTWVRSSWISDDDIAQMAATYPAPRQPQPAPEPTEPDDEPGAGPAVAGAAVAGGAR
jgi:S-DNA-T family DNA segregation ATPase FtsK/SpoIIIE